MNKKRKINGIITVCLILALSSIAGAIILAVKDKRDTITVNCVNHDAVVPGEAKVYIFRNHSLGPLIIFEDNYWTNPRRIWFNWTEYEDIVDVFKRPISLIRHDWKPGDNDIFTYRTAPERLGQPYIVRIRECADNPHPIHRGDVTITEQRDNTETLTCESKQEVITAKIPKLNIDWEKDIGNLDLPFYTRYGDKIVTLKGGLTLKFDKKTRRLELWMKSKPVPIVDKLPGARLKKIHFDNPGYGYPYPGSKPLKGSVKVTTPGYITLTNDGSVPPEPEASTKESKLDKDK